MAEVFNPRENMNGNHPGYWQCRDKDGNLICDGGPSIITDGGPLGYFWQFFISGIGFHRLDGPALSTGDWHIHGKNVTKKIKKYAKENGIDLKNLSDEDKVLIALKFG